MPQSEPYLVIGYSLEGLGSASDDGVRAYCRLERLEPLNRTRRETGQNEAILDARNTDHPSDSDLAPPNGSSGAYRAATF